MKGYTQDRVIFDRYLDVSLKDKTRDKRAAISVTMEFKFHDDMSIGKVSLKELFSNSRTQSQLTEILAEALLEEFKGSYQEHVASYDDKVKSNRSKLLSEDMKTHNHEEADTIIPYMSMMSSIPTVGPGSTQWVMI